MTVHAVAKPGIQAWDGPTVDVKVGTPLGTVDDTIRDAARRSATEDVASQVGFLLQHVGGRTVAACLGLSDARQLSKWGYGKGEPKSPAMVERIHLLFQVCYAITSRLSGANAKGFLLAGNPDLADEAPLNIIRGDVTEARVPVLGAVRLFLE